MAELIINNKWVCLMPDGSIIGESLSDTEQGSKNYLLNNLEQCQWRLLQDRGFSTKLVTVTINDSAIEPRLVGDRLYKAELLLKEIHEDTQRKQCWCQWEQCEYIHVLSDETFEDLDNFINIGGNSKVSTT